MLTTSFYPVVLTEDVTGSAAFYCEHFGFEKVYEADWYVSLRVPADAGQIPFELAILNASHPTIPAAYRKNVQGLILNFEVKDVNAQYQRLIIERKLPLELDIRDEEFGQRHFITRDPNGVLLDIITVIPPSKAQSAQYLEKIWSE
ncbi:VOC family protein [Brevibacillus panacihumi]|uniref:Glyoxalase/bleomycin resistance/extradiol dioxygenase family protein n=1 Tax=Brevibacillus panacihumi TaxID=497735 RepID=A0A3M8C294_9BACL|nr:VOC family protein [Brevibacillus panacihumi]RNB69065.1 glyoxalase/bleomycin resistance/extradiol dioxygenase family protein [Brevibacillus panacihumi]